MSSIDSFNILAEIDEIKNNIIELQNLIDSLSINIIDKNNEYENKLNKYKLFMENLIIEYHKICYNIYK